MPARHAVQAGLRSLGINITKYPPPEFLSHHLQRMLRKHHIDLVIDVGAHHGEYCKMLRGEGGYDGEIVSFEPSAKAFDILSNEMSGDKKWRGINVGLSDKSGEAVINSFNATDFNSLLPLRDEHARNYGVNGATTETIALRTLNDIWPDIAASQRRALLKTDTQGHDLAVISGAAKCFPHIKMIQSELPVIELYDGMTSMGDTLKAYAAFGYLPVNFFPVTSPEVYGGLAPEFDVLLLRRD